MAGSSHSPASFWTQANALLRKNLTFQKRNMRTNILLVCYPALLCILIVVLQNFLNEFIKKANNALPKQCDPKTNPNCPTPEIPKLPPLLQVPEHPYRAVRTDFIPFTDLPDESCRRTSSCPATILLTGNNLSLGEILAGTMITSSLSTSQVLTSLVKNELARVATNVLGSSSMPPQDLTSLGENDIIHDVQHQCPKNSISHVYDPVMGEIEVDLCVKGLVLWRNNSTVVNDELYKGYYKGNPDGKINEIIAAYDFLNSNKNNFNVSIWYNSSYSEQSSSSPLGDDSDVLLRIPRSVNLASNAYLHFRRGRGTQMLFEFVKDMNQLAALGDMDVASAFGPLFFTWVVLQLFPVALKSLVYEKQQKLRIMMKMHGLGNGPYWMISYLYFLFVSSIYMFIFVTSGALIGLKFFGLNDFGIQFVFYFIYINLQISVAFLGAVFFSNVKTATVIAYICVFGTGFLADYLFDSFVQSNSFPKMLIIVLELYPGFSLYRGINEFAQYVQLEGGMRWEDLNDSENGMREVLIIMSVEWLVVLFVAYGIDRAVSPGSGVGRRRSQNSRKPSLQSKGSRAYDMDKADVNQEREKVDQLLHESSTSHAIVCDNLQKIYPGRDGNPEKFAVRGLYLAVPPGECFGMLGPNGAGKTSFISMMIGLTKPTSGTAFIQGLDLQTHMDEIYTSMGVCPQHDLLWETLTGREHLLFYGRLKDLKGSELTQAVEESLKSLNLFHGGVADKQAGKYSGGMKRRLSVAISLIGDPKVVYMDEPSTGLDPASRNNLWNVVKNAKQNRAIILTTHSMEEAEFLCDRLGFFVDGSLQCIGNPKELKARYGGSYVFTITTSSDHEEEVENMVQHFSPSANKVYQLSGTQKFELPKSEARIADVFQVVETAKSKFTVFAWGLADTNLEDVFIKVSREARQSNTLT